MLLIELYYDYLEDCTKFMTMEDIDVTYEGKVFTIPKFTISDGRVYPSRFLGTRGSIGCSLHSCIP